MLISQATTPTAVSSESMLRLYLFGQLRAYVGDEVAIDDRFTRRKAKALLVLLYLERGRYISRDELLEKLWPNLDTLRPDSGRLKQTVLVLRRALEGGSSRRTGWRYIVERDGAFADEREGPVVAGRTQLCSERRVHASLRHARRVERDPHGACKHRAHGDRRTGMRVHPRELRVGPEPAARDVDGFEVREEQLARDRERIRRRDRDGRSRPERRERRRPRRLAHEPPETTTGGW